MASEVWTKDSYRFDVTCPGKPKGASITIQFDIPGTQHGKVDIFASPDGSTSVTKNPPIIASAQIAVISL
ncbi:MAG TPA: hypothetical protein VGI45_05330 [Terracidiphilus sp.]|jgi:hypothetical protein